jgi:hypothetical protein
LLEEEGGWCASRDRDVIFLQSLVTDALIIFSRVSSDGISTAVSSREFFSATAEVGGQRWESEKNKRSTAKGG